MATQVNNGAGFEYCCASSLLTQYRNQDRSLVVDQQSLPGFYQREHRFQDVKPDIQAQQRKAAKAVAHHITTSNERWSRRIFNAAEHYQLRIGDDARNMDVRDLLIYSDKGAELGISLKWNSEEIKSLRLGDRWFRKFLIEDDGSWAAATRELHAAIARHELWSDALQGLGKAEVWAVYRDAVISHIQRGIATPGFMGRFAQFLFGKQDYLKVMAVAKGKEISLAYYDSSMLPTKIHSAHESDRGTQYFEIAFDRGWTLLFRLHNKDSKIDPSNVSKGMSLTITVTGWGEKSGQRCWRVDG